MLSLGLVKQLKSDTENLHMEEIVTRIQKLVKISECQPDIQQNCKMKKVERGATNFEDSGGTGLGEGEGKKDVSDRIESEDQLESALKEGEKEEAGDKDLQEEDKGIEMNEDFEGKLQDVEKNERGENQDEEDGPGEGEATESKMVAKDDNKSKKERDKEQKKKEDLDEIEDTRKENEMNEDGQEYDDNFTDPYGGEANIEDEEEEKMELPDDMNLDNGDTNENDDDDDDEMDQLPGEIEEKGIFPEDEKEPKEDGEEEDAEENTAKGQEEPNEKESVEDDDGELGEKDDGEQDEEESSEERNKDERRQGTEEGNDLNNEENNLEDKAEASEDKSSKDLAEAAEMDTTDGSKDQTKEQSKSDTGGQREDDEEKQEEQGQMGEQTEDQEGTGQSESRTREDAHQGESSALVTQASANDQSDMKKPRRPGETDENRTLGDNNKRIQQGLMTKESKQRKSEADQQQQEKDNDAEKESQHSTYEHISKSEDHFDAHMVDAGTQEQAKEAPAPADRQEEEMADEDMLDTPMEVEEEELGEAGEEKKATSQEGKNEEQREQRQGKQDPQAEGEAQIVTEGETVLENIIQRPPETYFHTLMPDQDEEKDKPVAKFDEDVEKTRRQIEVVSTHDECEGSSWARQEAQVASVAMQLCEQLRLILEPTQAARLRGDYRTGKRLNMRKVIPYIASQFRKDKIWLRRTQPSKRTYQILVAVDDSESMMEARAGSLAVESVALVTRALTLLEVGQLGVISFGATTKILHPLDQPFNETSGNRILTNLKFDQKVTNFSRMLEDSVAILSGSRITGSHGHPDTAQLLLILSDGQTQTRMETVKAAVAARPHTTTCREVGVGECGRTDTTLAAVWLSAAASPITHADSTLLSTLLKEDTRGSALTWSNQQVEPRHKRWWFGSTTMN
ncbi:hypothetical protein O3P69_015232 [Scylla paramamosain]|uniref:VWFA domain-containing protein n=1 Tax=Scylla paramamosain TaxID=85552 RepID=A0AAW0T4J0_SCYPA